MHLLAVPFLVYELTGSNTWVGSVSFAYLIPILLLTPISGLLSDRYDRKLILLVTLALQALIAGLFAGMWMSGGLSPTWILCLSLGYGIIEGLQLSAWQSFVPLLVPDRMLLPAVRLNSAQYTASRSLGPLAGAGILALSGFGTVFIVNSVTFMVLLFTVGSIKLHAPHELQVSHRSHPLAEIKAELEYVKTHKPLLVGISVALTMSLFISAKSSLAAGLAKDIYHTGSTGLAGFLTAGGVGAIIAAWLLLICGDRFLRSSVTLFGFMCCAFGVGLIAASGWYLLGMAGFALTGFGMSWISISIHTSLQTQVADEFRGRVVSVELMGYYLGGPVGALLGGWLGDLVGVRTVYCGVAGLIVAFAVMGGVMKGWHRMLDIEG